MKLWKTLSLFGAVAISLSLTGCALTPTQTQTPQPVPSNSVKEPVTAAPDKSAGADGDAPVKATGSVETTGSEKAAADAIQRCEDDKPCGTACTPVSRLDGGRMMMKRGSFARAQEEFGNLFAANPRDLDAAFYQTWCLMMLGRVEEFFGMDAKTIDFRSNTVKGTLMDSWFARSRSNMKVANQLARAALKKEPNSAPCIFSVAISDENPKQAVEEINRALKLEPDEFAYIMIKGNLCSAAGDYKSAQQCLDKAASLSPKNGLVLLSLGEMALHQGNEKKANEQFQSALIVDPDLSPAYMKLDRYYKRTNKLADEIKLLSGLLQKHPNHPKVLLERGRVYYELRDYDHATPDFEAIIASTEGKNERICVNALAHMFRGHIFSRKGEYERARQKYEIAMKVFPRNKELELSSVSMLVETQRLIEAEKYIDDMLNRDSGEVTRHAGGELDKRQKSMLLSFKAKSRVTQGRWEEAIPLATQALQLDPTNTRALNARAVAFHDLKKYPQALNDFKKTHTPISNDQRGWIATCYFRMGKQKEAIAVISDYIKDFPKEPLGYVSRANFYLGNGQRAKAEADADAALKAGPKSPHAHWAVANICMALGRREEAAKEIAEALRDDTVASSIKEKINSAIPNLAGPEPLLIAFSKKTEEEPRNAQFYFLLGTCQMIAKRQGRAEMHLNKAISLNPKVGVYYVQRGILRVQQDQYDEALKDLNIGINKFGVQDPQGYDARGRVYMTIGQWEKAEKDLTLAVNGLPPDQAPYTERGTVYSRLRQDKNAIADFEKSLTQKRDLRKALLRLGPLYEANGENEKAIAIYNRLLSITPNEIQGLERRADLYMKAGRTKEAIADYSKVLTIGNAFTGVLYKRGKAYEKTGKFDLAEKDFAKAKGIDKEMLGPERKSRKPSLSVHY